MRAAVACGLVGGRVDRDDLGAGEPRQRRQRGASWSRGSRPARSGRPGGRQLVAAGDHGDPGAAVDRVPGRARSSPAPELGRPRAGPGPQDRRRRRRCPRRLGARCRRDDRLALGRARRPAIAHGVLDPDDGVGARRAASLRSRSRSPRRSRAGRPAGCPARDSSTSDRGTGDSGRPRPTSTARTAKPSIAELSKGWNGPSATASLGQPLSQCLTQPTSSVGVGRTRASTARRAASTSIAPAISTRFPGSAILEPVSSCEDTR